MAVSRSAPQRGWLLASYAGAVAFFALELAARQLGEASGLAPPNPTAEPPGRGHAAPVMQSASR